MGKGKLSLGTLLAVGIILWVLAGGVLNMDVPGYSKVFCPHASTRAHWSADDERMAQDPRCASISHK